MKGKIIEKKQQREKVIAVIAVVVLYIALSWLGVGCPIKSLTGISCAGCGMTRAWTSLLHLNIAEAFYYHPLYLLPIVFGIWWIFRNKISKKVYKTGIIIMAMLFLTVYIIRLINPDDTVVEINMKDGLIYRLLFYMKGRIKIW